MTNILTRHYQYGFEQHTSVSLTRGQLALDALSSSFQSQLGDWRSVTSMFVAGAVGKSLLTTSAPRFLSQIFSLTGESLAFEAAQRFLSPFHSEESFLSASRSHFINFATLRFLGPLVSRSNPFLQLGVESGGMVLGQNIASYLEGTAQQKSVSEQFVEASVFALQNRLSFAGLHALTGGRLQTWEHALNLQIQVARSSKNVFSLREAEIVPRMATEDPREPEKEKHRMHQRRIMAGEDLSHYFRVLEPIEMNHTMEDLEALISIRRQQREASGSKSNILNVCVLLRDAQGRVVLTYDRKGSGRFARVPSGGAEYEDQSVVDVMLREMGEELGVRVRLRKKIAAVPVQFFIGDERRKVVTYYLLEAELEGEIPHPLPGDSEVRAVEYVDANQNFHFSPEGMYPGINEVMNGIWKEYLRFLVR